MGVFF